ncbi:MAG: glycosyltransferase family 4 protein [Cyanobacterium sp. T60_A2020_053]|nr:glycosyltransferase family 4 protein [Cyanobacterium sp. T60_A2020_053]
MKSLLVNTNDISGGAARAAYRLHQGLSLTDGIDSMMLVQNRVGDNHSVVTADSPQDKWRKLVTKIRPTMDNLPKNFYPNRQKTPFSVQWFPNSIARVINDLSPDVVNIHWINMGFIPISSLKQIKAPLLWSLHDMWAFTGGCHYAGDCLSYLDSCGICPQLGSQKENDLSRQIWLRKSQQWQNVDFTVVALSHWLKDCCLKSSLFRDRRIEIIHNGIDTNIYKPLDKKFARNILNLPQDKKLILFGAMSATSDGRKGFQFLAPSLEILKDNDNLELVIFGASRPSQNADVCGLKTNYLGRLNDDISLALAYSAVDLFIAPSTEDNLPNTVMESLACGTPCVAFNIGGMPDLITHHHSGYLAKPFDVNDLAHGITWVLEDEGRWNQLSQSARQTVLEKFTLKIQAQKYLELYQDVIANNQSQ